MTRFLTPAALGATVAVLAAGAAGSEALAGPKGPDHDGARPGSTAALPHHGTGGHGWHRARGFWASHRTIRGKPGHRGHRGTPGHRVAADPQFRPIGTYATGLGAASGETFAYERGRLYVTNADDNSLHVVDASNPRRTRLLRRIDLSPWGAGPNSVDVSGGLVAVAVEADPKTDPGRVVFFTRDGRHITDVTVGALPDMLTFADEGRTLLVANEGEPSGYGPGHVDPEGSISIVDVSTVASRRTARVATVDFRAFNAGGPRHRELPEGIRLNGPGATVAQDLEPEYIAVSADGRTAHVTLQEANALAHIDVKKARVIHISALGAKDHSLPGNGLDASDRDDAINIRNWPVHGLYMPDAIASFRVKGKDYVVTANEGDARDWDGFVDEARVASRDLDPVAFPDAATLMQNENLGRLTISVTDGVNAEGRHEALYAYGARSISIWTGKGRLVWDSGDQLERKVAADAPGFFNSNHETNSLDDRSDNKGPEPEGVDVGEIRGRTYAFVGLERQGGFVTFDVTRPTAPRLVQWANNRDYIADPVGPDSGPEIVRFVAAKDSPTRRPLVVVSNEISGTVTFYESSVR